MKNNFLCNQYFISKVFISYEKCLSSFLKAKAKFTNFFYLKINLLELSLIIGELKKFAYGLKSN